MKRLITLGSIIGMCCVFGAFACNSSKDPGPDNTITVAITSPATQTYVTGQVQVTVNVTGDVERVELFVDDVSVGESTVPPFNINWMTDNADESLHRLRAVAYGPDGAQGNSAEHQVVVDRTGPEVAVADLNLPYVLSGVATLNVTGSDDNELAALRLFIDGVEQTGCTPGACQVDWDTLTVADGPAELVAEAEDAAGNVTTVVRPVAVVNGGTVTTFYDGSGVGLYSIPANWAELDLHQKFHFDMPAGITEIMAIGQWSDLTWEMEVDLGIGFCPHSGETKIEEYDTGGQIVLNYTAGDLSLTEFVEEAWFLHIGTAPDFDLDGHIDQGTYYALTVVLY